MKPVQSLESVAMDPDDVRILRALLVDPRVGFAQMAAVLGLSELTVARRYRRMVRQGLVRVTGVVDPGALGQSQWTVRLRCRPGSGVALAEGLALRDDVSWVELAAGGSEVSCAVRSRTPEQRDDLLGTKLPRAASVLDLRAAVMMRKFVGGRGRYWAALDGTLTHQQEVDLGLGLSPRDHVDSGNDEPFELGGADEKLLAALAGDGRASLVDLARAADLTTGRASRRLQTLLSEQVVHLHVEVAGAALGYRCPASLWLRVRPADLKAVGAALASLPEVGYAAALSGRDNLHVTVHCRNLDELFDVAVERIGTLAGVEDMEVAPVDRVIKQAGTRLLDDRLVDPTTTPAASTRRRHR